MTKLRIILADDHGLVRAGIRALIDGQPDMHVVGEAGDGLEVLRRVSELLPDLVVMDLSMPRLDGVDAARRLRVSHPSIPILILSIHEDVGYLRQAIEAGARGYLLKLAAAETLISAIRQLAAGEIYLDPSLSTALVHSLGGSARALGEPGILSEREALVLRLIAHGYSNKEIAGQLHLSVKTVETYKARAMEKLGISSRVEIVRYATAHGWLSRA